MGQMLQNPALLQSFSDPNFLESMINVQQALGQMGGAGANPFAFAAVPPAATATAPASTSSASPSGPATVSGTEPVSSSAASTSTQPAPASSGTAPAASAPPAFDLAALMQAFSGPSGSGAGGAPGAAVNPFAALFGPPPSAGAPGSRPPGIGAVLLDSLWSFARILTCVLAECIVCCSLLGGSCHRLQRAACAARRYGLHGWGGKFARSARHGRQFASSHQPTDWRLD